jgi:hypothetical protein
MASPAAILSILVQTQGAQAAASQIRSVDKAGKSAGGSMGALEKSTKRTSKTFSLLGTAAKTVGPLLGAVGVAKAVGAMNSEFREAQKTGAQTTAVLKSTGNAAKVTQKHIENLAGAISMKSGIDDEAIQSSENMLLTFTKVRNEVGKGNQIFDRATQTVTDMSVALGQSGKSSAIQLGKALNDPIKGITALRRVGVSFTAQQQKQIETLVKSGDTLSAQKLILRELNKEFGGSAAAQATAGDKLKVSLGNLAEAAGGVLVPQLDKAAVFLSKMIDEFVRGEGIAKVIIPAFYSVRDAIRGVVTDLTPMVQVAAPALVSFFESLPGPVKVATAALAAFALIFAVSGPLGVGLVAFAGAAVLIKRNWDTVGPVLQKVAQIASTVAAALVTAFNAVMTAVGAVKTAFNAAVGWVRTAMDNIVTEVHKWDVAFAVVKAAVTAIKVILAPELLAIVAITKAAMAEIPVIFRTVWGVVKAVFTGAWTALKAIVMGGLQSLHGVIQVIGGIFKGDFGQIWDGIKNIFRGQLRLVKGILTGGIQALGGVALAIGKGIVEGVLTGLGQLGHLLLAKVKDAIGWVTGKVKGIAGSIGSALNPFGDGIGKPSGGVLPSGGAFGGSLKGAQSALKPFAAVGSRFGLSVTSGRRPGAITASGNVSYHSSGEAIDMGDGRGPDANKMNFFRYMKSHFGGRLAELIYGPGQVGIKNGQPYNFGAALNAQHMDHVHVAFDTGKPGVGDGIGRASRHVAQMGDGIGQIKALWTRAGGSSTAQNMAAAIAMAESGGNPKISHKNSDGSIDRGLWQINSTHGALSTFDRLGNAKAAVSISGNGRNWNPWSVFKSGAYKKFLTAVKKTKPGKNSKPNRPRTVTVKPSGPGYETEQGTDGLTAEQQAALDFSNKPRGPLKGSGSGRPLKGLTPEESDAIAANQEDANQPLIDALAELARIEKDKIALETQLQTNQLKIIAMANQGPQILAAVIAAVNGGIGGQVGLGLQTPGYAGGVANYGGSAGRL